MLCFITAPMFNFGELEETILACQLGTVTLYLSDPICQRVTRCLLVSPNYLLVFASTSYYERISMDSLIKSKVNTLQTNSNLQSTLEAFSLDKDHYLVSTQAFLVSTTAIYYLCVFARYLLVMNPRLHGFVD